MDQSDWHSNMQMDERLSAAIDNELTAEDCHELVDELAQQPALQRAWERQHAVNALLRGEQIGTSNAVSWDRLQDAFQSRSSLRIKGKKARIVDFKYFCTQHAAKWAGGTALAASVLLGVSLLSTLYRPSFGTQGPFASEAAPSSPPMSQFATANQIPTRSHVQTADLTTNSQTNEYLAAEQKKREVPSNQPNSRTLPSNQPPRELVRLVSDKPN